MIVREWAQQATGYRIVLCGYDTEHDTLLEHGWTRINGRSGRGAGYSTRRDNGRRERLWLNPECLWHGHQDELFQLGEETA